MNAIRQIYHDAQAYIPVPESMRHQQIEVIFVSLEENTKPISKPKKRTFGSAKGLIKMSDDFDAPLDDFQDYQ